MALNICMIGYGFMGKAHSNAIARLPMFFPETGEVIRHSLCGKGINELTEAALRYGWQNYSEDALAVIRNPDINAVDIATPTDTHTQYALSAAEHGKHIFCEKPLAINLSDARAMLEAAVKAGVTHQTGFNYRFAPAVLLFKRFLDEGRIGRVYHARGRFLQEWLADPAAPMSWRLEKKHAGSGALGDLGAHVTDLMLWLFGDISEVCAMQRTFVPERRWPDGTTGRVTVDDAYACLLAFDNGVMGTIELSRNARGHKNGVFLEVNGEKGSLRFQFERMNELEYYDAFRGDAAGWTTILATGEGHPMAGRWWPDGHVLGYEHTLIHEYAAFIQNIRGGTLEAPDFSDGVKCARLLDAMELSAQRRAWVRTDSL